MQRIAERCKGNEQILRELNSKTVQPIADQYQLVLGQFGPDEVDEEALRNEFADYGRIVKKEE